MARYMLIEAGVATNAIEVNDPERFPQWVLVRSDEAAIGDLWDSETLAFSKPAATVEVPQTVTMRQARLALFGAGLMASVDAAIAAMPSPQKEAAQIEWDYSQEVQRNRPIVAALAAALGLTDEQVDALFVTAKDL